MAKYWGKRDEALILPYFDSLSVTLDAFFTTTSVEFSDVFEEDSLELDGEIFRAGEKEFDRLLAPLSHIREQSGVAESMRAVSKNDVPTAAGLASSASGTAAFVMAAAAAAGLNVSSKELSILARMGSGSASRSLFGGFAQWHAGTQNDGSDSFAEQLVEQDEWPEFRVVACIVSKKQKKVASRAGMKQTVATSPLYEGWKQQAPLDVAAMKQALAAKDFTTLGQIAESSFAQLHATMLSTNPPILYMAPASVEVIDTSWAARERGEFEGY
ncbi:MAG: diphosphomevalonate decarboxylase, partial [Candidatus Andersenbacteria bacterium]|nr:diphosphomevalonate decarboxylase [Candidatus Andersenbacteria bacterium]